MATLTSNWSDLHQLFQRADTLSTAEFTACVTHLSLPTVLKDALKNAIRGDTQEITSQLFGTPASQKEPVALFAPLNIKGVKRNAWMIGYLPSLLGDVRQRFIEAHDGTKSDPLLINVANPPAVLFIETFAVSNVQMMATNNPEPSIDDFAIFRTSKSDDEKSDDIDRRLLLNATLIEQNLESAYRIGEEFFGDSLTEIKPHLNAKLLGMIHAEGHNRGHFAGPWPFTSQKSQAMHEAVEEFRACLCAIQWGEHLGLTDIQKDALAVSVFLTRFLHYGLRSYRREIKTRQSIREISVALMFFETLRHAGAIQKHKKYLRLEIVAVRPALKAALSRLHVQEKDALNIGHEALREMSREWYHIAYPKKDLSPEAYQIYNGRR